MGDTIGGIHHVTAIASDPQRNLDFYTGVLGLRLVKRTVNFDDPGTYHLYFGDRLGRPGTILTFFPWPRVRRGIRGPGQATATSFSIPESSMGYWIERLERAGVIAATPRPRFEEEALAFTDPDGLELELVAHADDGAVEAWGRGPVPAAHAIRGFHSVTLTVSDPGPTNELLTGILGLRARAETASRIRFQTAEAGIGSRVDVVGSPEDGTGRIAAGTVHHVAWRLADDTVQAAWRERLIARGQRPTEVLDRQYFKSIYFREPGGVLFELATDGPGFGRDEAPAELGSALKLPPWLEAHRQGIEGALPSLALPPPPTAEG